MTDHDCDLCGDTGWVTRVDADGYGYDTPCPEGCPGDAYVSVDDEAPF